MNLTTITENDLDLSNFNCMDCIDFANLAHLLFEINLLEHGWIDTGDEIVNIGVEQNSLWLSSIPESISYVEWNLSEKPLDVAKKNLSESQYKN